LALPTSLALVETELGTTGSAVFISPFDMYLSNGKRTKQLFDFDYQIECLCLPRA